jgi:hypothetical protein
MQRAKKIFTLEEYANGAPFVAKIWRTRSEPFDRFISVAATHWEVVVTRQLGRSLLTIRGPETKASLCGIPPDAEFFGIEFALGAFMPSLLPGRLVDGTLTLPEANGARFWLDGEAWEMPAYDTADVFVEKLVHRGLLVRDPVVAGALQGDHGSVSARTLQRRVQRATGLTQATIRQIERAEKAAALLESGAAVLNVVAQAGYADQPHLTRSLKRFMGQSPKMLAAG